MASNIQRDQSWAIIEISRQWSGSDVSKSQGLQRKGFNNTKGDEERTGHSSIYINWLDQFPSET